MAGISTWSVSPCRSRYGHQRFQVHAAAQAMIADYSGVHPHRRELALGQVARVLQLVAAVNPRNDRGRRDPRITAAIAWANAHLGEPIGVADLARVAELSPSRFAHVFSDQMGESPRFWIERRRIALARDLLLMTADPVAGIAEQIGLADASYFARVFARHTGVTPSEWRRGSAQA